MHDPSNVFWKTVRLASEQPAKVQSFLSSVWHLRKSDVLTHSNHQEFLVPLSGLGTRDSPSQLQSSPVSPASPAVSAGDFELSKRLKPKGPRV